MVNVKEIICEVCNLPDDIEDDYDLFENEKLDSYAFIELFTILEDEGIELQPTRIDKERLKTPASIQQLVNDYLANN